MRASNFQTLLARPRARFDTLLARPRARFDTLLARPRARFDTLLARPRARFDTLLARPRARLDTVPPARDDPSSSGRRALRWLCCTSLLLAAASPQSAHAAPARPAKGRAAMSVEEVAVMLSSSDEDEVRTALETAATLPARDIIEMLDDRIRAGLSRVLLDVAIDSLLLLDDKASSPLLTDLAQHRRPEVRVRALEVIGRLKSTHLESVLVRGLSDLVPEVRKAAADALGESGARGSIAPLTRAFELGVEPAGAALGRIAKPDDLTRLLDYVGRLPIATVTPMVATLLARRDLSEADKLRAAAKVTTVPGDDATTGSEALLAQLPSDASPRVRRLLTEAVEKGNAP